MKRITIAILICFLSVSSSVFPMNPRQTEAYRLQIKADSLFNLEQFPLALEYYIKGLEAAERDGEDKIYMHCTGYISNIYDAFGDYKSAIAYLKKGLKMAQKYKLQDMMGNYLINLVMACCRQGDVENAKYYYEQSKKTPLLRNNNYWKYYLQYNKANILKAEGKHQEAIKAHEEALDYANITDFNGDVRRKNLFQLFQESEIGNLYVQLRNHDKAREWGYICTEHSKKVNSNELLANAYKMLAEAYRMTGNADSTDKYMSLYVAVADSVYDRKSFYTAQSKLAEYEDKLQRTRVVRLWYIIGLIGAVLLLVGILLFLVILNNKRLHAAQRMLIAKTSELERQDRERQQLLNRYLTKETAKNTDFIEENTSIDESNDACQISQEQKDILLKRIIEVLSDINNISKPDFNLNMLAELTESNTKYVSMVINETYNKNFKSLLNEYRCREASHLLRDEDMAAAYTMQAVYEAVGYTNATSFIRAFKAVYGMTPSTYKKL